MAFPCEFLTVRRLSAERCANGYASRDLFVASNLVEQLSMTKETVQTPLAVRPRQAAKALGISPRLLWQLTHDGHIPCVRVGSGKRRTVLYPTADLQAWLSRKLA